MIVTVGALVWGATGAFFSDTETSTGNTFTAGAIDLKVDSEQHYNGMVCTLDVEEGYTWQPEEGYVPGLNQYPVEDSPCSGGGTWGQDGDGEDIANQKFFNFADIKPGDEGENTISLHVLNNDAYVCAAVSNLVSDDVSQTEPESQAPLDTDDMTSGELDDQMVWTIWKDDGDNIQQSDEPTLVSGHPVNGVLALYDSTTSALVGDTTAYLGVKWELPSTSGNETQTDSLTGDISFEVVQSRNNGDFVCGQEQTPAPTVAASYETGFEPSTFSIGNINGQDGWMKTGSYDAAVVNNPVINDTQSLRISNAVTSGAFGDQTFAPLLSTGAGETGIAPNKHFEAQFNLASVLSSLQSGLVISVSPDNGSGARMSYLRFEDQSDGIHVFFDDVTDAGPLNTVATFNETDIATITRTSHTIKFVMDFVDGPANDVVKIYIDSVLVKTGTSWEDYYRFDPEQNGNSNLLSAVNTLIFRAGGTAVPANSGNGFLFDKVSLWSGSL
jgi:predicted ribosomally synthesized peptide with SipW-like signal peptide